MGIRRGHRRRVGRARRCRAARGGGGADRNAPVARSPGSTPAACSAVEAGRLRRRSDRRAGAYEACHHLGELGGRRSGGQVAPAPENIQLGTGDLLGHVAGGCQRKESILFSVQDERWKPELRKQVADVVGQFRIELSRSSCLLVRRCWYPAAAYGDWW